LTYPCHDAILGPIVVNGGRVWMKRSQRAEKSPKDSPAFAQMERMFMGIYNQPLLQAMVGLRATDASPRRQPGEAPGPGGVAFLNCRPIPEPSWKGRKEGEFQQPLNSRVVSNGKEIDEEKAKFACVAKDRSERIFVEHCCKL